MTPKKRYAHKFGLPADQIRYYNELTQDERDEVYHLYGSYRPERYVYAIKRDGGMVWRRVKR